MKKSIWILSAIGLMLFGACSDKDDIEGRIVGDLTLFNFQGDTLEHQDGVVIKAKHGEQTYSTITDTFGRFSLSLPLGEYTFEVEKENFGGITDFTFINTLKVDSIFFLELAEAPPVLLTLNPSFEFSNYLARIHAESTVDAQYMFGINYYFSSSPEVSAENHEHILTRCCVGIALFKLDQPGVRTKDLLDMGYKSGDVLYVTLYPSSAKNMLYYDPYDDQADPRFYRALGKQSNVIQIVVQ